MERQTPADHLPGRSVSAIKSFISSQGQNGHNLNSPLRICIASGCEKTNIFVELHDHLSCSAISPEALIVNIPSGFAET